MNKLLRVTGVAALSASLLFGLSEGAWAGGDRDYRGGHGYGHTKHYNYRHHDHHGARPYRHYKKRYKHDDDELLIGLLFGGLFGYAIGNSQRRDAVPYDSYPPATTLPAPRSQPEVVPRYDYTYRDTCLQEREYQTTVTIGGKQVPAYGTACLQPDGSWRREPAQVAAY